jgi:hypothetical protein
MDCRKRPYRDFSVTRGGIHVTYHPFTFYDVAKRNAEVYPDRLALIESSRRVTFKQFLGLGESSRCGSEERGD